MDSAVAKFLRSHNVSENMSYENLDAGNGFKINNGDVVYYINENSEMHRDTNDGPALVSNSNEIYYVDGKIHRSGAPAKINKNTGTVSYYKHGVLHNAEGAAICHGDGKKEYFVNGTPMTKAFNKWAKNKKFDAHEENFIIFLFEFTV